MGDATHRHAQRDVEERIWNGTMHGAVGLMAWIDAMRPHSMKVVISGGFIRVFELEHEALSGTCH
jgi:hypothetical protein